MVIRAVIFDFDGVIISSLELQRQALLQSYAEVVGEGAPSFDIFISHAGDSLENIFRAMHLPQEMCQAYRRISRERLDQVELIPGSAELLHELKESGVLVGLCTGKDRVRTLELLQYLNIIQYFDCVLCSDDVAHPKPHPESLLACLHTLKVASHEALFIGDSANDLVCAASAEVDSIAVLWGETKQEVLLRENPKFIVSQVAQLRDLLIQQLGALNNRDTTSVSYR
ncbi:HAD family hydrolase [Paenibacillus oenotherae]|uniref:HAD family hydrolase n=1 Tax=Paenibacillus oenotherae TaxID=1435645 RepID=A0ABS7D9R7_9BACL|nr:HAD family hydrolase [Paenibacillus oenotherae]